MLLTLCIFTFASLVAVDPVSEECIRVNQAQLADFTTACAAENKDPLSTCEIQRMGALKVYIRVRHLAGHKDEGPPATPGTTDTRVLPVRKAGDR